MNKTIFVKDLDFWELSKSIADAEGLSMSEFIARALESYVNRDNCPVCAAVKKLVDANLKVKR